MEPSSDSRRRVLTAIAHIPAHALPEPTTLARRPVVAPAWRRLAASIAAATALVMPGGIAVADTSSVPGDPGYGVRRTAEHLWIAVTWGDVDVHARRIVAARRLEEAAALRAVSGSSDEVQALLGDARRLLDAIPPVNAPPQPVGAEEASAQGVPPGVVPDRAGRPEHAAGPVRPDPAMAQAVPEEASRGQSPVRHTQGSAATSSGGPPGQGGSTEAPGPDAEDAPARGDTPAPAEPPATPPPGPTRPATGPTGPPADAPADAAAGPPADAAAGPPADAPAGPPR